jgi:hypothetical protein
MNATARYPIRAVAITFEKHVPRRRSAPQLSHQLGADAWEEWKLVVRERLDAQGAQSAQGSRFLARES